MALVAGPNNFQVPLDSNLKMIFCRLNLARPDIDHNKSSQKLLSEKKEQLNGFLKRKYGVDSIYEAYEEQIPITEIPDGIETSK